MTEKRRPVKPFGNRGTDRKADGKTFSRQGNGNRPYGKPGGGKSFGNRNGGKPAGSFGKGTGRPQTVKPVKAGEEGMRAFEGMVKAFFTMGGFCLHGNVLNTATLLISMRFSSDKKRA